MGPTNKMAGADNHYCKLYCYKCQKDFNNRVDLILHECPEDIKENHNER